MSELHKRVAARFLKIIGQDLDEEDPVEEEGVFGGKGPFNLPDDHVAAIKVPKGGSCCANCHFGEMRDDGPHCNEPNWTVWNGGNSRLPVDDPETYCSDWYKPGGK